MPALYALLIIGGIALYLAYLACAVPIGAAAGLITYGVGLPVAYFVGLGRVLVRRDPAWLAQDRPAPRRPKVAAGADPAVVQYFYGPALIDAGHGLRTAYRDCRRFWRAGWGLVGSAVVSDGAVLTAPFGVGFAVGMGAGVALGAVLMACCACVHLLTVGVCAALVRAAGTALRLADSAVLRVKNIRMVCPSPSCYQRVPYPGYECPGADCTRRHKDIRPGRLGILSRRCPCGTRMKTLLLFGSSGMKAFCPHCGRWLEHNPGKAQEIVLPFFGAVGAGKTRLLFSLVAQLQLWAQDPQRLAVEFADTATARKLEHARELLSPDSVTDKTPVELPRAYIIRLTSAKGVRLLHMFDAAGELFDTAERTRELGFLDKARTFILVIDPLSVEAFRNRLPPEQGVRSTAQSPDLAYQEAHQEIEAMGVPLRTARLAVVFSRADLIDEPVTDVADWAKQELGLGNLVRSVRMNFGEARFFHTAAVLSGGVMHASIPELLRWVLASNGIEVPEDPS
jgi:hypothetical protein